MDEEIKNLIKMSQWERTLENHSEVIECVSSQMLEKIIQSLNKETLGPRFKKVKNYFRLEIQRIEKEGFRNSKEPLSIILIYTKLCEDPLLQKFLGERGELQ